MPQEKPSEAKEGKRPRFREPLSSVTRESSKAHAWQLELAKPADQWWRPCIGDSSEDESDEE